MSNLKVWIFFAIIIGAWANFKNIQISTYDDNSENCGGRIDPSPFTKIGEKYYFVAQNEKVNWFEADRLCRKLGADLATIESDAEMDAVSEYLLSLENRDTKEYYLSLNNFGKEKSIYSIDPGGNEICLHIFVFAGMVYINDGPCRYLQNYICQIGNPKTISFTVW